MTPQLDLIDWFFGLSLFKQLFTVLLLGPLAASVWALIDDWKRPWSAQALAHSSRSGDALAGADRDQELRKAA